MKSTRGARTNSSQIVQRGGFRGWVETDALDGVRLAGDEKKKACRWECDDVVECDVILPRCRWTRLDDYTKLARWQADKSASVSRLSKVRNVDLEADTFLETRRARNKQHRQLKWSEGGGGQGWLVAGSPRSSHIASVAKKAAFRTAHTPTNLCCLPLPSKSRKNPGIQNALHPKSKIQNPKSKIQNCNLNQFKGANATAHPSEAANSR